MNAADLVMLSCTGSYEGSDLSSNVLYLRGVHLLYNHHVIYHQLESWVAKHRCVVVYW